MSTRKARIPAYCYHKSDDSAVVYINRRPVYLGRYGSPESRKKYGEVIAEFLGGSVVHPSAATPAVSLKSVGELCLQFVREKLPKYSVAEQHCQRGAIKILVELFAETATADFGPLRLRTVRQAMIDKGWGRSFTNKQMKRLKYLFRWGVSWEYVPASVADALATVDALKSGETDAPEPRTRSAVPVEKLKAIRDHLRGRTRDLFDLVLLSGARPGELISLTTEMIDRSGEVWSATLKSHKTAHFGRVRTLHFNKTAQGLLLPYLQADPSQPLFTVRRSTFGNAVKAASEVAFGMPDELRKPAKNLTVEQRADVRKRAIEWRRKNVITPHWLRHCAASKLADELGIEAAQRVLGHADSVMTQLYTRAANKKAIEAVQRLG